MSILKIQAREIFDSRGNPTVEVDLYTNKGESLVNVSLCCTSVNANSAMCLPPLVLSLTWIALANLVNTFFLSLRSS